MNEPWLSNPFSRLLYRGLLGMRHLRPIPRCDAFASQADDVIRRVYVINLDRHGGRWSRIRRELARIRTPDGGRLTDIARRFSALDARYRTDRPDDELTHEYSLADQLFVDPQPLPRGTRNTRTLRIEMSQQEAAVARSHIGVWKLIADGTPRYTMVLEDDAYFGWNFARTFDRAWTQLQSHNELRTFDLLYLSYKEAREGAELAPAANGLLRPSRGLWQLSGYVLSKTGAQRLLSLLPVRGPVDLWINHQFRSIDVLAMPKPVVHQRLDCSSSNSHSVLPILSKVGVLTAEEPPTISARNLPNPVFAAGDQGSGLTSLATALSMLGYTCCSDVKTLAGEERDALFENRRNRVFNAYVNIGSLGTQDLVKLVDRYPRARFILTSKGRSTLGQASAEPPSGLATDNATVVGVGEPDPLRALLQRLNTRSPRVLVLPRNHQDKWEILSQFLGCDYPSHPYPECADQGQRPILRQLRSPHPSPVNETNGLKRDSLPWIVKKPDWHGFEYEDSGPVANPNPGVQVEYEPSRGLDEDAWMLRDDTFPSNLALFSPANFGVVNGAARLTLREENAVVRRYTSASLSTNCEYRYGRFSAELKPASVPGLITGLFLHRNSPRQEIDIEFLGNDTTRLLLNVYYNPGYEGAKFEYGYRGTPAVIMLGFDAADDFHLYEIKWSPTTLTWLVDGRVIHRRVQWNPTPIPHLPMRFHMNLWTSRSRALAGKLARANLPDHAELRRIEIST